MSAFFAPIHSEPLKPPQGQASPTTRSAVCQPAQVPFVGETAHSMSEAEIDAHIKSLGELAEKADKDGDPHGARLWTDRMYAAIRGRSAAHQARLQAEVVRRIDELTFGGDWAREQGRRLA